MALSKKAAPKKAVSKNAKRPSLSTRMTKLENLLQLSLQNHSELREQVAGLKQHFVKSNDFCLANTHGKIDGDMLQKHFVEKSDNGKAEMKHFGFDELLSSINASLQFSRIHHQELVSAVRKVSGSGAPHVDEFISDTAKEYEQLRNSDDATRNKLLQAELGMTLIAECNTDIEYLIDRLNNIL